VVSDGALELTEEDLALLEEYSEVLRPILARHGTVRGLRDWLLSLKDITAINQRELANAQTRGALIPRDFVKTHFFGALEELSRNILKDSSKKIVRLMYAAAKAGESLEVAERTVRDILSAQLNRIKTRTARSVRNDSSSGSHE